MEIADLKEKLEKISLGCDRCKAKMCSICPNEKMKKSIRSRLKTLNSSLIKEESLLTKIKNFFIKS